MHCGVSCSLFHLLLQPYMSLNYVTFLGISFRRGRESWVRNRRDILILTQPSHLHNRRAVTKNVVYQKTTANVDHKVWVHRSTNVLYPSLARTKLVFNTIKLKFECGAASTWLRLGTVSSTTATGRCYVNVPHKSHRVS